MKKVFVTGGGGQLGLSLKLDECAVFKTGRKHLEGFEFDALLDITDKRQVQTVLSKFDPDVILHLAAMTNVDGCELEPERAHEINVNGTANLLEPFEGKFIFLSTDYVFDGANGPYSEADDVNPINTYGKTKLAAEEAVKAGASDWLILRTNVIWNIGGNYKASFADWLVEQLSQGKQVNIVTDQWNNPTQTGDLGRVINELLKQDGQGLYHYGSSEILNRYDFARLIANIYDLDEKLIKPIKTEELNQPAQRPLKSGLKTEKIERDFGITPSVLRNDIEKLAARNS